MSLSLFQVTSLLVLFTTNTFSTLGVFLTASSTAGFKTSTAPLRFPPSEVITNYA
jgi:hypothetical protein